MDTINYVLNHEKNLQFKKRIYNPLSGFHDYLEKVEILNLGKEYIKRGLALCHGHNHRYTPLSKIKFVSHWYLVDSDQRSRPDYVADIGNDYEMSYFPDNYFDCVMSIYCSYGWDKNLLPDVLKNVYRILKTDGILVMTELMGLFYHFISEKEFDEIVDDVKKHISDDATMASLKEQHLKEIGSDKIDRDFYENLFVGNYIYDNKKLVMDLLKKFAKKYTKELLAKNHFKYIGKKGGYMLAKKILI